MTTQTVGEAWVHYLAPQPSSVPRARRLALQVAEPFLEEAQCRVLELAVTEVISNAVRHGAPSDEEIKLAITPKDGYICVQVTDSGPGLVPQPGAIGPAGDDGGFGLFIVEQVTRRWGVTREEQRTRVWFELDFAE